MNAFEPKRFLLFAFELGEGHGGTEDLKGSYDTKKECVDAAEVDRWGCFQIYDTVTGKIYER